MGRRDARRTLFISESLRRICVCLKRGSTRKYVCLYQRMWWPLIVLLLPIETAVPFCGPITLALTRMFFVCPLILFSFLCTCLMAAVHPYPEHRNPQQGYQYFYHEHLKVNRYLESQWSPSPDVHSAVTSHVIFDNIYKGL